jgi:hypothetical protein
VLDYLNDMDHKLPSMGESAVAAAFVAANLKGGNPGAACS